MKKIEIKSENHNSETIDISSLQEIRNIYDIQKISSNLIKEIDKLTIKEYENNIYVFSLNGVDKAYIKGEENLKEFFEQLKEKYNIEVKTNILKMQTEVESNPKIPTTKLGIEYVEANLYKYNIGLLYKMYENSKEGDTKISNKILHTILKKLSSDTLNFNKKLSILKEFENNELLYKKAIFSVLKSINNEKEGEELLNFVGKEKLKEVIKEGVMIDDKFAASYTYYFKSPDDVRGFSISCGKGYTDQEACEAFTAYIFALKENNTLKNYNAVANVISKSFDGNLTEFKDGIGKSIQTYQQIKGKLPDVAKEVLKKKGLVGLMKYSLDKTNMTKEQKRFWSEVGLPIAAVGVAIYVIFKILKENGWKGLLGLIVGEIALESTTGNTMFDVFTKVLYGGFDFGDKDSEKAAKKGAENKQYADKLGFPMFTLFMMGGYKIEKLYEIGALKWKNGKVKFDVDKFINDLPENDERRLFLENLVKKQGKEKVNKMFEQAFNEMGLNIHTYNKWHNKKVSALHNNYLLTLKKDKGDKKQTTEEQTTEEQSKEKQSTSMKYKGEGENLEQITQNNETEPGIVNKNEVVVIKPSKTEVKLREDKTYYFKDVNAMTIELKKQLEAKLGKELYDKVNEKLKLLNNLQTFYTMLSHYADISETEDSWLTFKPFLQMIDNQDEFIEGADDVFKSSANGYGRLMQYIINAAVKGEKKVLNILLSKLDDKNLYSAINNISGMIVRRGINKFNEKEEQDAIVNMLKSGDAIDIAKFFADKEKETSFIETFIFQSIALKGIDFEKAIDDNLDISVNNIYKNIKFYIGGKEVPVVLPKDDIEDILEEVRGNEKLSKTQKIEYLKILLSGKILDKQEDTIKALIKKDKNLSKLFNTYYEHNSSWDKFKDHWASNLYKGVMITGAMILTDGTIGAIGGPSLGVVGTGLRFGARVAGMHNVAGNMSLLLNDNWTLKGAKNIGTDLDGYIYTAAYLGAFKILGAVSEFVSKIPGVQKIGGTLEKIGVGKINFKNFTLIGIDTAALLGIDKTLAYALDGVEFNGEFTADEIANALIFALVIRGGEHISKIKFEETPNGEIKVTEIIEKGERIKTKIEAKKKYLERLKGLEEKLNQKLEELNINKPISNFDRLKQNIRDGRFNEILRNRRRADIKRIVKAMKRLEEIKKNKNLYGKDLNKKISTLEDRINKVNQIINTNVLNTIYKSMKYIHPEKGFKETFTKNKKTIEIKYDENTKEYQVIEDGDVTTLKEKEFKKYLDKNLDIKAELNKKMLENQVNEVLNKYTYEKDINGFKIRVRKEGSKEVEYKIDSKKYVIGEKGGEYYMIEKDGNTYKTSEAKKIDDLLKSHPELINDMIISGIEKFIKVNGLLNTRIVPDGFNVPNWLKISMKKNGLSTSSKWSDFIKLIKSEYSPIGSFLSAYKGFNIQTLINYWKLGLTGNKEGFSKLSKMQKLIFFGIWSFAGYNTLQDVKKDMIDPNATLGDVGLDVLKGVGEGMLWNMFTIIMAMKEGGEMAYDYLNKETYTDDHLTI